MRRTTRIVAVVAALATAVLLTGCSSPAAENAHADHTDAATTLITEAPAGYNDEDVAFATNMIPHHQQAVDMSALVPDRSTDPAVITLAQQISAAQGPEIDTLKAFLVQWTQNPDTNTGHTHDGMPMDGAAMNGMVDAATLAKLESLKGAEFDTLWLQSMIGHHEGAIEMANTEIAKGTNVDAVGMAKTIVATQQGEIATMKQMLAATGG